MSENYVAEMDLEERLLDHLSGVQYEDLSEAVVSYCKLLIVDALGVTFPGSLAPGCQAVVDLTKEWSADSGSRVLIHGNRTTPPLAALANSTMMHALDFDDTLDASALHTFVSVLPAALAVAESAGPVDGKRLMTALVLGVDLICRLSLGIRRPLSWIRTATCGSFGAAATSGILLGMDREGLANALGIVYSQTSGNAQGLLEGRLVKRMQPGFAAQAGVISAFLAKSGITGSRRFLQGEHGFYRLYERDEYDPGPVVDGLGDYYTLLDLSLKPYPCCRMTHASIDAVLQLRDGITEPIQDVEQIIVRVSKMVSEMVGKPFTVGTDPQVDAQFSIPYTVSTALLRGDVFLEDFETDHILEGEARLLSKRVEVVPDPALSEKDIIHSTVAVRMKNGQMHMATVNAPLGNPANPLDMTQCQEKFSKCLVYSQMDYDAGRKKELLSLIEALEDVQDVSMISTLMQL